MQLSFSIDEVCAVTGIGKTKIYQLINMDMSIQILAHRLIVYDLSRLRLPYVSIIVLKPS